MIQDSSLIHHLTYQQIKFLNCGPTYVPPCQIHILSKSSLTLTEIVTKQIAPLRRGLTKLSTKYPVDLSRRMNFEKEIQQFFHESFVQTIPAMIEERAIYEKKLVQSIQYQLKKNRLMLRRTADNNNTYYLGQLDEFEQKENNHMQNATSTFELIGTLDNESYTEQYYLNKITQAIDSDLVNLVHRQLITNDKKIKLNSTNSQKTTINLPSLYFLPDINDNGTILVQPTLSSFQFCPIYTLANYFDQLLRPLFENYSRSTIFLHGDDFMHKLQYYCTQQGLLRATTHFATFQILNLSTDLLHSTLAQTLNKFLIHRTVTGRYDKLSIEAIEELISIVLQNLFFIYKGKIYRYIKGLPLNLSFKVLLNDIYLHHWQLTLVREFRLRDSFYGRYQNMGFLTWNAPTDLLYALFDKVEQLFDSNIKLGIHIDIKVNFLQLFIENRRGSLYTRCSRDRRQSQLFLLPYTRDHPRLFHRQWFRFALMRAGLYCSSFEDFENERIYLEATLLANGYALDFVEDHLRQFYFKFYPIQQQQLILNSLTYNTLRRELFRFIEQQKNQMQYELQLKKIINLFNYIICSIGDYGVNLIENFMNFGPLQLNKIQNLRNML